MLLLEHVEASFYLHMREQTIPQSGGMCGIVEWGRDDAGRTPPRSAYYGSCCVIPNALIRRLSVHFYYCSSTVFSHPSETLAGNEVATTRSDQSATLQAGTLLLGGEQTLYVAKNTAHSVRVAVTERPHDEDRTSALMRHTVRHLSRLLRRMHVACVQGGLA